MPSPTVVIAGAGISGLTVAYDLLRRGVDCVVLEREERIGGLIWSARRDAFLMDCGPDAFLAAKPDARRLAEELGLGPELIPTNPELRKVYVLHRGRLHAMPDGMRLTVPTRVGALLGSSLFTPAGKLRLVAERFVPRRRGEAEESVASFVRRRFGREALERVGEPLLAGIHCGDAERLSMDRLFPRLVELERRYGSVTRGMIATAEKAVGGEGSVFLSLRGGMSRLVERLAEQLPAGVIRRGETVRELRPSRDGYVSVLASGEEVRARTVVLALPLRGSEALLESTFAHVAATLRRIPTVSTAVGFHAFRREDVRHPLDGYGFVVPAGEPNRLLAATFVSTKFPGRAPPSTVLIRTFLGGGRDPEAFALPDDALLALSREELERALGPLGAPLFSRVARWEDRTPQIELGHDAIVNALEGQLLELPGLHILASGLGGIGIPDSIANARALASKLVSTLKSE